MEIELRPEEEKDFETVENLTREAFWNFYVPGCDEHLLIHNLRKSKDFIRELDFVAICNNKMSLLQNSVSFVKGFRKTGVKAGFSVKSKEDFPEIEILENPHLIKSFLQKKKLI
jgi:hypothetical protein